jgi:GNAT superfamily N-acetyltransferase
MDAATLWATFAEHAALVMSGGRAPSRGSGEGWFAVVTGEAHPDLNECALTSRATAADARALVSFIAEADVPALVSVSSGAGPEVTHPLAAAGFERAALSEPLMWCPRRPQRSASGLRTRQVRSAADRERAIAIIADAHAVGHEVARRALAPLPDPDDRVMAWLAFQGDEAISVVWVTPGPRIGVWEMMTPARHRRKGAASAALTGALEAVWDSATEGAYLWSTPAGRPLYESLGFAAADEAVSWTIGADEAFLTAIGQPAAVTPDPSG